MADVFAVQVFFIMFRETLEASIMISVLLSFLKQCLGQPHQDQSVYKRLVRHVWIGSVSGILITLVLGGIFIGVFYGLGHDLWSNSEEIWEGVFYLIATIIVTIMGLALLRINKSKEQWRVKIATALLENHTNGKTSRLLGNWARRYSMFLLPFVTTLREGLEAVVFVGGVSLGYSASAFPLPVITGLLAGGLVGFLLYRGGNALSIQLFLIASTCVLYLIAAGMFSRAIWALQFYVFRVKVGGDVAESGDGPGSYNIRQTVWHVNCCNPERDNGWDIFNAILGWQNTGTYGSVISYNAYWIFITLSVIYLLYEERKGIRTSKERALSIISHFPGFKNYAQRKLARIRQRPDDVIRQVHSGVFDQAIQVEMIPMK